MIWPASRLNQVGGYAPDFFSSISEVQERHFWFRARNRIIAAAIRHHASQLAPGYRVLEVGCGTGNVTRVLERMCSTGLVVGFDLFEVGLQYARQRLSCPLVQGDLRDLPFRPGFSIIGLFDVLEHQPDDIELLKNLHALLAPDGVLVLTVPAHQSLWSYFDEASRHCRRYELDDLERKLRCVGYRVEFLSEYMAALFPLLWLRRRFASLGRARYCEDQSYAHKLALQELRVIPGLNALLTWVLAVEVRFVARGHRLPIGTSLLAVVRRAETPARYRR